MEFNTQKSSHVHYVVKRQEIHFWDNFISVYN
jgi:hypothetical protein